MDQLTLHVRNARIINTTASELKDITAFLKRIEDSSKSGLLTLEGWSTWFNRTYHVVLSKIDSKLYLFSNDDNSPENVCKKTVVLRGATVRKAKSRKFVVTTASLEKQHFIAETRQERDSWCSKILESIKYAQNNNNDEFAAYRNEDFFINSQEIIVIDDNKQQGIIDPDIHQIRCCVEVSSSNSQGQQIVFYVRLSYDRTILCIVEYILNFLAQKYNPMLFRLISVNKKSCTNKTIYALQGVDNMNIKMNTFNVDVIQNKGLYLVVTGVYHHTIQSCITCEYMLNDDEKEGKEEKLDPMICPIYRDMIEHKAFDEEYLVHIEDETHFEDEFSDKPLCPHKQNCQAFKETERGQIRTDYKCHMALYRHPPTYVKQEEKGSSMKEFIMSSNKYENRPLYIPTEEEFAALKRREDGAGFYDQLMNEVKCNGFEDDLWPTANGKYMVEKIVKRKMKSKRHVLMGKPLTKGQMLALVLMTGSEKCCVDIGYQHRSGNYKKWKWFDYCLYWAIYALSQKEFGQFKVYAGLNNVYLPDKLVKDRYFITYVSTSWQEHVATKFMGKKGMILEIDELFKNDKNVYCCDVSWLSKFPDECEILFARSIGGWSSNSFSCEILDQKHGIQRVLLTKQTSKDQVKNSKRIKRKIVKVDRNMMDWDVNDCINWVNSINKGAKFPQKLKDKFIGAMEKVDVCDGELFHHCENVEQLCQLLDMNNNKVVCKRLYQYIQERKKEDAMKMVRKYEFDSFDEGKRSVVCLDSNYEDLTLVLGNEQQDLFENIKQAVDAGGDITIIANGLDKIIDIHVEVEKAYV